MKKKIIGFLVVTLLIGTAFPAVGTVINNNFIISETSDDHNNLIQHIDSSSYNQGDWAQQDKLTASDGAVSDLFAGSVCIDGDYAIVGAYYDDSCRGSAYVFSRDGTSWAQIDKLIASDGETNDYFGCSVSISGDYAIVGAFNDDSNMGSAYVFKRSGSSWIQEAKLTASDGESGDWFGCAVSINGDYAIVGANGDENQGSTYSGSAYVFKRDGTSWMQEAKLTASPSVTGNYFGSSVCIDGDYTLVGVPGDNSNTGSAYVFKRDGTSWMQEAKLTASDGATEDRFGSSVSISGVYAIVGAWFDDSQTGSAYVFKRDGTSWMQDDKLTASDGATGDCFGYSVSIDGDYCIVGASFDDSQIGSAYVFKRSGSSWIQEAKLTASDGESGDNFGNSVSIVGDYCIVGAYRDDSAKGSAYVFKKITPDLDCLGSLSWTDVPAGSVVTGSFQIANVGDSGSELSWEIESYPTWGTWTFVPSSGTGLTPEMGAITVAVEVIAPNEVNEEFTGDVKVVNSEDINNFDLVPVLLKTPRNKAINNPFLNWLQSHPILFPTIKKILVHSSLFFNSYLICISPIQQL
jgi:hypothetical protein